MVNESEQQKNGNEKHTHTHTQDHCSKYTQKLKHNERILSLQAIFSNRLKVYSRLIQPDVEIYYIHSYI